MAVDKLHNQDFLDYASKYLSLPTHGRYGRVSWTDRKQVFINEKAR